MGGSGREREKEREEVVKGEGENEGVEEQKVRRKSANLEERKKKECFG